MDDGVEMTELASDDPSVIKHLSAELRAELRRVEIGEIASLSATHIVEAAAIVNAFASARLLEFVYLPPEESSDEDDVAVFSVSEAAVIEDAPESISLFGFLDRATDPLPLLAYEPLEAHDGEAEA